MPIFDDYDYKDGNCFVCDHDVGPDYIHGHIKIWDTRFGHKPSILLCSSCYNRFTSDLVDKRERGKCGCGAMGQWE